MRRSSTPNSKTDRAYQRYRRRGTTTQRGYGYDHAKKLAAALAVWTPGDPCAHCGQPMWSRWTYNAQGKRVSALDLGHNDDRTGYIGLAHRYCNRADGARRGNQQRGMARTARASRQW